MEPKQAFQMIHDIVRGPNGMRLTASEHQAVQQAFMVIQKDMNSFKVKEIPKEEPVNE